MTLKEMRAFLSERGVKCVGCVEKSDFEKKVRESMDLPVVGQEDGQKEKESKKENLSESEILKMLEKAGLGKKFKVDPRSILSLSFFLLTIACLFSFCLVVTVPVCII